jgi:hypothetical protein
MKFSIGRPCIHRVFASSQRKHLDHATCCPLLSFSAHLDPVSARRASSLGFVAQPSNTDGFVVNGCKPRGLGAASAPIPLMTWLPCHPGSTLVLRLNQETVHDFVLLFLPPCDPHLIPFSHWVHRVEPTYLSTLHTPHRLRSFMPALHLHLHKSSRNLHLQYSAKSQCTPHCQSLTTPTSDHPLVLERSCPQWVRGKRLKLDRES